MPRRNYLGFNKNDYKYPNSDYSRQRFIREWEDRTLPSLKLHYKDVTLDIMEFLRDISEEMALPLFERLTMEDLYVFLSRYNPIFSKLI